ncbi:hypothetical protein TKK_0005513 [Trichogramma kaykai]
MIQLDENIVSKTPISAPLRDSATDSASESRSFRVPPLATSADRRKSVVIGERGEDGFPRFIHKPPSLFDNEQNQIVEIDGENYSIPENSENLGEIERGVPSRSHSECLMHVDVNPGVVNKRKACSELSSSLFLKKRR